MSREGCDLCEEMLAGLDRFLQARALRAEVSVVDVDSDAALRTRYGLKVPVLLLDDEPVCHGHLDAAELDRLLRRY